MRRLLEWLDLSHTLSGAIHVTAGLCGLAIVSGALIGGIGSTEAALRPDAARPQVAAVTPAPAVDPSVTPVTLASLDLRTAPASDIFPAIFQQDGAAFVRSAVVGKTSAVHVTLRDLEKQRGCLTQGIYYEARGESIVGQFAVGQVILNRVLSGRYPANICGVVFQGQKSGKCQFSFACNGDMNKPRDPVAWRKAQRIAHYMLAGKFRPNVVGPSTYYHATYVNPSWAHRMVEVVKIGQHIFYKSPDMLAADDSNPS